MRTANPHLYPEPEEPEPLPPEHEVEDERQDTEESTFGVGDDR